MIAIAANSTADGSVIINVDMDVSDAEKELARLKRRVFKLEDDIEGKEYERNALVQKRRGLEKELTALKKERQATGAIYVQYE